MHVAVDGSLLIDHPNIPESLHLIEWISMIGSAGAQVTLLHPEGALPPLPPEVEPLALTRGTGALSRLAFQQREIPRAAGDLHADLLLVGEGSAPLTSPCPIVAIAALAHARRARGIADSIAAAAGKAGDRGAIAVLSPSDAEPRPGLTEYSPWVAPEFLPSSAEVQEPSVLCYGFRPEDIPLILSAWTWVDGSLGDSYPLTMLGVARDAVASLVEELDIVASVRTQPEISYQDLPALFGGAAAFLSTTFVAGGQPLRWALATEAPVVAIHTADFERVLGGAAYLVPPGDSRTLGAACLTVLIQERVSEPLREKGRQLAEGYTSTGGREIMDVLIDFVDERKGAARNGK